VGADDFYYNKRIPNLSIFRTSSTATDLSHTPSVVVSLCLGSESEENLMDEMTVKIVAGVLALVLLGVIVLRRKSKAGGDKAGDDF
jgi:hypothetical protein